MIGTPVEMPVGATLRVASHVTRVLIPLLFMSSSSILTDDVKVDTTNDAACDCCDFWDYVNEICKGCEVKSGWNASRCHVHGGTACGVLFPSLPLRREYGSSAK